MKLMVPTYFPFEVEHATLIYTSVSPEKPTEILHTIWMFRNDDYHLHLTIYHHKETVFPHEPTKSLLLNDGTKVLVEQDGENVKSIRWKNNELTYAALLMSIDNV